jgi:hypothetical protein
LQSFKIDGSTAKCRSCGILIGFDSSAYHRVVKGRPPKLKALIAETNPELPEKLAARQALDKKFREKQTLTPAERQTLLQEPFVVLCGKVVE